MYSVCVRVHTHYNKRITLLLLLPVDHELSNDPSLLLLSNLVRLKGVFGSVLCVNTGNLRTGKLIFHIKENIHLLHSLSIRCYCI